MVAKRSSLSGSVELDLDKYELRRSGMRISIERIPMELLILLAQSGGRLLSREEIIEHLWGKNPWLDAERNLNTAIGKLRRALGDHADRPRFIETVVGKGYRFILSDQKNGASPSSPHSQVHFELVGAPGVETAALAATDRQIAVSVLPDPPISDPLPSSLTAPVTISGHPLVIPVSENALPRPSSRRRFGWRSLILIATVTLALGVPLLVVFRPINPSVIPHYELITSGDPEKVFNLGEFPLPILSDSVRLYFPVLKPAGELTVGQVSAMGGESGAISTPLPSPVALDISPDRSGLLVASPAALPQAPLWIQPIPEGQPRRLANVDARSASWSPDGLRIAYSTTSGLFTVRSDGTDVRRVVGIDPNTGTQIYWPRWSRDASRLRYSIYDPKTGYNSLWQVKADGTGRHPLLPGWSAAPNECCGSWTPDGRFFVFAAVKSGRSDIWAISEKPQLLHPFSQRQFQLTAGPISFSSPLPAPGGNIFVAGTKSKGELARWDSESKMLTAWFGGISAVGVTVSRDGKWLAYTSFPELTLWRCKIDGSQKLQLTQSPTEAYLPRWSPDGRQIAFYARTSGMPFQIYLVSPNGEVPHRPISGDRQQIDPTWSSDGRQLMFESDPWQQRGSERKTHIEILDLQNGKSTVLPGSSGLVSPRWSPDGRFVAAMRSDSSGLMLFDFATQTWTRLLVAHIGYPNWSHNGKYIYFDSFSSPAGVRRIRMADHAIQTVVSRQPGDKLWTADDWTGLAQDDSVLLLRNVSIQEIYALRWQSGHPSSSWFHFGQSDRP